MNSKYFDLGFEFEFCHHFLAKQIKREIEGVLWDDKLQWLSKSKRNHSGYHSRFYTTLSHDRTVDVDFSDQREWELSTAVWSYDAALVNLQEICKWMETSGATTNESCSLHVNMSLTNGYQTEDVNKEDLIHRIGEFDELKKWGREQNIYCRPHKANINLGSRDVAMSFRRNHYVEFRMIGNKDYHLKISKIFKSIDYYAECLIQSNEWFSQGGLVWG